MITFRKGNLLNSNCKVICHQVNCMGIMGAGIAKQIKDKWPNVAEEYKDFCNYMLITTGTRHSLLGKCYLSKIDSERLVANIFSQYDYGRINGSTCYTDYEDLDIALTNLKRHLTSIYNKEYLRQVTIGFPYNFGCGLAGGDWNTVLNILHKHFDETDWNVEIWKLPE